MQDTLWGGVWVSYNSPMRVFISILLIAPFILAPLASAETVDAVQEPLAQTQALLKDPTQRAHAAQETPQAAFADQQAANLAGSQQNTQAMYDLSASILGSLSAEQQGDPAKMMKQLEAWKKNPEEVANHLSTEQKAQLKTIAERTPASGAKATVPVVQP